MSKTTATTRVHLLAKELGVSSKDIIAKCAAEGIPGVTNHQSTVKLGLAATIREWFGTSGGGTATAVETAARVDVVTARAKVARKTVRKPAAPDERGGPPAAPAAPPAPTPMAVRPSAPVVAPPDEHAPPPSRHAEPVEVPRLAARAPDADRSAGDSSAPITRPSPSRRPAAAPAAPKPVMNVPQRPEVVAPAGPRLHQPTKTKLSGPKVIRVEAPEILAKPKPAGLRRDAGPIGRAGPRAGRGVGPAGDQIGEMPPDAGRGGRAVPSRRNKRRTASAFDESGRSGATAPKGTEEESRPFNWREQDLLERELRLNRSGGFFKQARRDNLKKGAGATHRAQTAAEVGGKVRIAAPITIKDLSAATGIKAADIVKRLFLSGKATTVNSAIDAPTAVETMLEYGIELEVDAAQTAGEQIAEQANQRAMVDERSRSPVVTILGHVDHGKTSLLDRIRNTNVAAGEAGGITQATSAFQVPVRAGDAQRVITFIDTPGHEAFTEMRARGAKVTDLVVLVVAADDGVMPQTIESINHAAAAKVPIVVALNKVDKPEATESNIQRILGQLAERGLNPAEWGGTTEVVKTSATKGEGIQDLLEVLDYQSQLLDLKADFVGPALGTVLEARSEEGRGAVANILVQQGRLAKGDPVAVGRAFGRVRDIVIDRGQRVEEAHPSTPVVISGIDLIPDAGDKFYVVTSLRDAEDAARERRDLERQRDLAREKVTLDNIFQKLAQSGTKELPLVVKADVHGSMETLKSTLERIATAEVRVTIKHIAIGGINESDVLLAEASGAIVIGFNVTAAGKARKLADAKGVDIRLYDVIYDISDDVTRAAEGLLEPEHRLDVLGHAEVRAVFKISRVGMIAGCYVTDGVIERNAQIRVTRQDIVVEKDRRLEQLKRFKDDVKEVRAGQECGMKIDGYDDIKAGDVLECYKTMTVRRTL